MAVDECTTGLGGSACGIVFVHSCPRALMAHVEWCLVGLMGAGTRISWQAQPVLPGSRRCEVVWRGRLGLAAEIASGLRAFPGLRFEVTQDPTGEAEGDRYSCTPSLGIHRAQIGPHGDVVVGEARLLAAMARAEARSTDLVGELRAILGVPWDEELEPFRYSGEGADVRVLHRVC